MTRLLPESVPWLAANGKIDEAEAILRRAATAGGIMLPGGHLLKRHQVSGSPVVWITTV
jgi:hypothetical protein